MKKKTIVLLFALSSIAGMSYSQELVGSTITIKDAWDNVLRSTDDGKNYDLIGTYRGWNTNAIYIAGYNYQSNPSYYSAKYVSFGGSGIERMWIDLFSGNVGIGTTTPLAKFHVAGDGYSLFGPNSTWGALLRIGGNGNVTNDASVVATNGNLHLDGAIGNYGTYLNYYHGSAGILFGNGAQSIIGTISGAGNLAMNGTGTFGANTLISGQGNSFFNGGNLGIGTTNPDQKLTVNGKIHATEVIVDLAIPADYVFKPTYKLMPLHEVEQFVKTNSHLPEIPSAAEITENGLSMGEMQNKLLQKVEELTLYIISQQKTIDQQQAQIKELNNKLSKLNKQ